jgi:hypothetical protein
MKSLFYLLSVVAIGAAGFFGWTAKENYTQQLEDRNTLIEANDKLSKSITEEEARKAKSTDARALALDEKAETQAELDSAVSNEKVFQRTLDEFTAKLEEDQAEEEKVDMGITKIEELFPGIQLDEVAAKVQALKEAEKKLSSDVEDLELFKTKLTEDVAKNGSDIVRVTSKVEESVNNIKGNTFQASVTAVDHEWDFVIIGAGEKSGLTADTKLLVVRGGRLLGKLSIHQLEANRAVADIEPGSVKLGSRLRPGDQVILEKVRSN